MKKNITKLLLIILPVVIILLFICFNKKEKKLEDYINISELSETFMDEYFEEISLASSEEKENMLIVISDQEISNTYGAKKIINAPNNQYILEYSSEEEKNNALSQLKKDESIHSVEENSVYTFQTSNYNSWGIEAMGLDHGMEYINSNINDLENVVVAIIDTGCDLELFNKYYSGKILETYNVLEQSTTIMNDEYGHGTHIAGTIAEGTPDNVKIIPIKISNSSDMHITDIIAALNYVVYNDKADVINMSFGSTETSESLYQSLEAARQKNIISVAAAGNINVSSPFYPASFNNTISVSSVDSRLNKSDFSNYGQNITFTAPGTGIKSTMASYMEISQNHVYDNDDDFETINGTSMATPHVVNAVAILKSFNKSLTLNDTIELLKMHAIDLGEDGWDSFYGYGFIDFSNVQFCDGTDCDQYNVFKNNQSLLIKKIDVGEDIYESLYNYGSNSNILNMEIKIYYDDEKYIIKELGELEDLLIENYDPYLEGEQIINITYKGNTAQKRIINYLNNGFDYEDKYNNGKISIKGINQEDGYPKYLEIPTEYNGFDVDEINGLAFMNKDQLKIVTILAPIKEIKNNTFTGCQNLKKIILPNSVEKIGYGSFSSTRSLESIEFPTNLSEIGENAFASSGLNTVIIPGTVKTISSTAFANNFSLYDVVIEEGVLEISSNAFGNCTYLSSITIPESVNKIEANAFGKDYNLYNINIDSNNQYYENLNNSNTIIDKVNNYLIFANEYSEIPEEISIAGPYSLTAQNIYAIPNNIKVLKNYALNNCNDVILNTKIDEIESNDVFDRSSFYNNFVYKNSYSHDYLKASNINYLLIDTETIEVEINKTEYNTFDQVDETELFVSSIFESNDESGYKKLYLSGGMLGKHHTISYKNGNSFKYGDEYFNLQIKSKYTNIDYNEKVYVTVSKRTPTYQLPENITIEIGKKLSEISLPTGFEWVNPDEKAEELGAMETLIRYVPEDTNNYEIVENIDIIISVTSNKIVLNPNISINNRTYDGTTNISTSNITINGLNKNEYSIISAISSSADAGEQIATIKLKLSDEKFIDYAFDNGKQEKEFKIGFTINKADINITDNSSDVTLQYDGNPHTIQMNLNSQQNIIVKYMDENDEYTLDSVPIYVNIGTYVIKYKAYIDSNYNEYFGQKTLKIQDIVPYQINNFVVDETNHYIDKVEVNTESDSFTSNIILGYGYGIEVDTKNVNGKNVLYTGGKTRITHGLELYKEYTNIVSGDTNGDGKINYLDYVNVYNHIQKSKHPELNKQLLLNEFLIAADIADDNKINYLDYVRIYNKIKELKGGN